MRMRPPVGSSRPATSFSVVVLPEPDGPSSTKNSLSRQARSSRSTATVLPNRLVGDRTIPFGAAMLTERRRAGIAQLEPPAGRGREQVYALGREEQADRIAGVSDDARRRLHDHAV